MHVLWHLAKVKVKVKRYELRQKQNLQNDFKFRQRLFFVLLISFFFLFFFLGMEAWKTPFGKLVLSVAYWVSIWLDIPLSCLILSYLGSSNKNALTTIGNNYYTTNTWVCMKKKKTTELWFETNQLDSDIPLVGSLKQLISIEWILQS